MESEKDSFWQVRLSLETLFVKVFFAMKTIQAAFLCISRQLRRSVHFGRLEAVVLLCLTWNMHTVPLQSDTSILQASLSSWKVFLSP